MKKIILSLVAIATISLSSFGQAPEGFKYQAVVRDAGGLILNNQAVGMRLTVQQGSIGGTAVYAETFSPTTNAYGLVNLEIGTGTTTVYGDCGRFLRRNDLGCYGNKSANERSLCFVC